MSSFELVAAIIAGFFVAGIAVGSALVIALAAIRSRPTGKEISLNPDDPKDAEKIVERWLASRGDASTQDSE